jgi:serine/threonine protein kinase
MLSGGKLMDEGLYGCIFTPPLRCKDKPKQLPQTSVSDLVLSKIILNKYADQEFSVAKTISKIPLWKNYFIVSESICSPARVQKDKDLDDCDVLDDHKLSEFKILQMPYGGMPLNTYRFNLNSFDFMDFTKHFIEAGALLNLFGIVHRDIHHGNILVDNNDVPRIIDFNLSIFVEQTVTASKLKHQYSYNTSQEPPDSTLVNAVELGYKPENIMDSIIFKKTIIKRISQLLGVSQMDMLKSLQQFYFKNRDTRASSNTVWFHNYWRTIDSWAIGVNILDLISKLSLWPEFSPILRKNKAKLFPVLKKLCAVSPSERIDCVQALNYLDPNNFIIRKYAKPWLAKVGTGNIV